MARQPISAHAVSPLITHYVPYGYPSERGARRPSRARRGEVVKAKASGLLHVPCGGQG